MEVTALFVAVAALVISLASYAQGRLEARRARRQLVEDRHELAVQGERMRRELAQDTALIEQLERDLAAMRGAVFGRLAAVQDLSHESEEPPA